MAARAAWQVTPSTLYFVVPLLLSLFDVLRRLDGPGLALGFLYGRLSFLRMNTATLQILSNGCLTANLCL